jgi:hypothetical protein
MFVNQARGSRVRFAFSNSALARRSHRMATQDQHHCRCSRMTGSSGRDETAPAETPQTRPFLQHSDPYDLFDPALRGFT